MVAMATAPGVPETAHVKSQWIACQLGIYITNTRENIHDERCGNE